MTYLLFEYKFSTRSRPVTMKSGAKMTFFK